MPPPAITLLSVVLSLPRRLRPIYHGVSVLHIIPDDPGFDGAGINNLLIKIQNSLEFPIRLLNNDNILLVKEIE